MITLKGITWDHDRGLLPLVHTSNTFHNLHPDIRIEWKKRSLRDFGDYSVANLAEEYDLLMIDHPFSGEAHKHGLFVDLAQHLPKAVLDERAAQAIGPSHICYTYGGQQLALAADTAALVAAARADILDAENRETPKTLRETIAFAKTGGRMALPLCPTDIWCLFLSLGAAYSGRAFISENHINMEGAVSSIEKIIQLYGAADPRCIDWNPIQLLEQMTHTNEIWYTPYVFGYVNYAHTGCKAPLTFADAPLWAGAKTATVLGGVGIAISARCRQLEAALRYVEYVTRPEIQRGEYFLAGGQPGQKDAWLDAENNRQTGGFFVNTISTIENAYVRPRHPNWNVFQEQGGALLNQCLRESHSAEYTAARLEKLHRSIAIGG